MLLSRRSFVALFVHFENIEIYNLRGISFKNNPFTNAFNSDFAHC